MITKPAYRPLKGPARKGIGWIEEDWPDLNSKLVNVKEFLNRSRPSGVRKLSSPEVLNVLLDAYIKAKNL